MSIVDQRRGLPVVRALLALTLSLMASMALVGASAARAAEIESFSAGVSTLQAGAHPDSTVSFEFRTGPATIPGGGGFFDPCPTPDGSCETIAGGAAKDIVVDLPRGLIGNPNGFAQCTLAELTFLACPSAAQVGVATVHLLAFGSSDAAPPERVAVFNMVPERGKLATLGMNVILVNIFIELRLRSDGGITATVPNTSTALPVISSDLTVWGAPGDSSHDPDRACTSNNKGFNCQPTPPGAVAKPFMTNGPECVSGFVTMRVNTWQHPNVYNTATSTPQTLTGCEAQGFDADMALRPTESERGKPTGLSVDLTIPDTWDTAGSLAVPPLRDAIVTLPAGTSISPPSADGLVACTDQQLGLGNNDQVSCPNASKIGDVTLVTPVLPEIVTGGIYLRTQASDDPASGRMFRIALELRNDERGLLIKIPGDIVLDPSTGVVTTRFLDNPQLPSSRLRLHFKAGPRAPLSLPTTCGVHTTRVVLTGWGVEDRPVTIESPFTVTHNGDGRPCPRGFAPSFTAGTTDPVGGKDTQLTVTFARTDDDQELQGVSVHTPQGLLAHIANVPLCAEVQAAAGGCGEESRIGDVTTGAGSGSNPFFLGGRVYLTGPYRGAPFGLSIVVPAVAGPFDLGTVVVRAAIFVDRKTAELRIDSDPLPTMLKGVILHIRSVNVHVNRSGFMLNPTSCAEKRIDGTITSTEGAAAAVASRFQVGDCASLAFNPKMRLTVGGRGHLARGRTTPLTTTVTMPRGNANLRFVRVALPTSINARLTVINDACTRDEFETDIARCGHARAGTATAVTPLLRDPLTGSVYFVKNGHPIPDLFVALRGQVDFDLIGRVTIPGGKRLATTFDTVPDVPIRSFVLRLFGDSRNGSVGAATNLCSTRSRKARVALEFVGQNGVVKRVGQRLQISGCARRAKAKKAGGRHQLK